MDEDESRSRLFLESALQQNPDLVRELLNDPQALLQRLGASEAALRCPDEAHEALSRGERVAADLNAIGDIPLIEALPRLGEIIRRGFEEEPRITKVPFGIRFTEQVRTV